MSGDGDLMARWQARVERELAREKDPKAAFAKLTTRLVDGMSIAPLYAELPAAPSRAPRTPTEVELASWPVTPTPDDLDLREPEQSGLSPAEELATAALALAERPSQPVVHVGLSPDILLQIAKLRALRRLAQRLTELDSHPRPFLVHAHTSVRHFTRHDPWVNQLRNCAAVFAALLGQADLVTPVPWDAPLGEPSEDAKRLADHTVRIAIHESHLVADDPAFGAFALEQLTEDLCAAAWALAADPATLATRIAATRSERHKRVARRQDFGGAFVGATLYPDLDEPTPTMSGPAPDLGPRLGLPFEALRTAAETADAKVFVATLGPLARHMARTTWVTHLLAAGGLRAVDPSPPEGYPSIDAAAEAFAASGCTVAILSLADPDWGEGAATLTALADSLSKRGATVMVAGRPTPALEASGSTTIAGYLHAGLPALDILTDLHARLGLTGGAA
jgi:methylmalonyl-CoA mutase